MIYHLASLLGVAAVFTVSYAKDYSVAVGRIDLAYTPDHLTGVEAGDTVTFSFFPTNVTVTECSFTEPCKKLIGGIDSGVRGISSSMVGNGGKFTITVNHTQPIWMHCEALHHCASGMVFAVNPGSLDQLAQFRANAARSAIVSVPPEGFPGHTTGSTAETTTSGFDYSHNPVASDSRASIRVLLWSSFLVLLFVGTLLGLL